MDNGLLISIEDAIAEYNSFMKREPALKGMLPIFDSGGADFLLVDCDKKRETYNQIFIWSPAMLILEPVTIYHNLISLLSTTIRCFMVGAYCYNDDLYLEIDDQKQYMEAIRINPRAEYWKAFSDLHDPKYPWY